MTGKENKEIMVADVNRQLAPKFPSPKEKIDMVKAKRTLDALRRPPPPPPLSDYDRCIVKTYENQLGSTISAAKRGKTIPQLGKQEKQLCPPLKVFTDIANDLGEVAGGLGVTLGDYLDDDV